MPDKPPVKSVLFCATPRSGSTFICNTLANTGLVGTPDEWLHVERIQERRIAYSSELGKTASDLEVLKKIVCAEKGENNVFGIKIMWPQYAEFAAKTTAADDPPPNSPDNFLKSYFPNPKIVFIRRQDELRQAISWTRALKTGVWHSIANLTEPRLAAFDFPFINKIIRRIQQQNQSWQKMFQDYAISYKTIIYENFRRSPKECVLQILGFLELPPNHKLDISPAETKLSSDGLNDQWEEAYRETLTKIRRRANHYSPQTAIPGNLSYDLQCASKNLNMMCREQKSIQVVLHNAGEQTWPSVGELSGEGWIKLQAFWQPVHKNYSSENADRAYLPKTVPPKTSVKLDLLLTAPDDAGIYDLKLDLSAYSNTQPSPELDTSDTIRVEVSQPVSTTRAEAYFGRLPTLAMIWTLNPWFGNIMIQYFPWVYHMHHGWLFCAGQGHATDSFWFWDSELGWFFTRSATYPHLFSSKHSAWLRYHTGTNRPRIFTDVSTGKTVSIAPSEQNKRSPGNCG